MSQNDPLNSCTLNTHESKVHQCKQVTNMSTKMISKTKAHCIKVVLYKTELLL